MEHGTKTFYADAEQTAALEALEDEASVASSTGSTRSKPKLKWGERAEEADAAKEARKTRLAKKKKPDTGWHQGA